MTIQDELRRLYVDVAHTDNAGHIAERVADPAADIIDAMAAAMALARDAITGLADQQAMPDDSYKAAVAVIDAALLGAQAGSGGG